MFIYAKEAAALLGFKSAGRDAFKRLGIEVFDGPTSKGGGITILVKKSDVLKVAAEQQSKKHAIPHNNQEALERNRFRPTEAAMEFLKAINGKLDRLIEMWGGKGTPQ